MTLMRNEVVELHYPREHYSKWDAWQRTSTGRPLLVEHEGWLFRDKYAPRLLIWFLEYVPRDSTPPPTP